MADLTPAEIQIQKFHKENAKAKEALDDVRQLLSHADERTRTRRELVELLRERADFIEGNLHGDEAMERLRLSIFRS